VNNFDKELIKKHLPKEKWEDAFLKLEKGYPVQYIIGNVDFCDCNIKVNEDVLIPRFETEYLVDDLIKLIEKSNIHNPKILDIGTGSGCISIALMKSLDCTVETIDKSEKAIKLAKENAKDNNCAITFKCISIEDYQTESKYDVIVSNPPYVAYDSPIDEKIKYEPKEAIFADNNGLYFYNIILDKASKIVNKKSIIAFEIGNGQTEAIKKIINKFFPNANIIFKKDLNNYDRYIYIINN